MANRSIDSLAGLLEGPVRIKRNKTGDITSRAKRIVNNASEVMVKVSGNSKGPAHVKAHLDYISRNGKIEIENERGEILKGKDALKEVHKEWTQDQGRRRRNTRDTTNIVLSMPKGTDARAVKDSARDFAKKQFGGNYQYVFALHTDVDHPHVHLTVKTLGFDGRRLHVKKGDPQVWREEFAEQLQTRGIDAEATPRAPRGVVKKGVKQAIRHIREKGLTPEIDKAKIKEIVERFRDVQAGKPERPRPWERRIEERQTAVRKTWVAAARELSQSAEREDQQLAGQILHFVKSMPPLVTERHEMAAKLTSQINNRNAEASAREASDENLRKDDLER